MLFITVCTNSLHNFSSLSFSFEKIEFNKLRLTILCLQNWYLNGNKSEFSFFVASKIIGTGNITLISQAGINLFGYEARLLIAFLDEPLA